MVPALPFAGLIARHGRCVTNAGTLPCDTVQFGVVALASSVIIVALNFLPVLALGPILEHLLLRSSAIRF